MKDPQTLVHKGYGFVSFANKVEAESAITQMNGQWLGTRKIRTNWATRKIQPGGLDGSAPTGAPQSKYVNKLDYNEVWARASDTNTTVYCGGVNAVTDEQVRQTFGLYGQIIGIHAFPDRGYAFVRFTTKEAACNAICGVHGMEINGGIAKCSWGKENIEITGSQTHTGTGNLMTAQSLYANPAATSGALGAAGLQGVSSLAAAAQLGASNPWGSTAAANTAAQNSSAWTAANYQWAATAAAGYPQNYWQGYAGYQNAAMMQGWGVMPTAAATATGQANAAQNAAQYAAALSQYQQSANGKS
jgi:hypothetical protein